MKKTLLTLALVGASLAAFAQGKVSLQNDGSSLYTLTNSAADLPSADGALAGQAVPITGPLPSGVVLEVGLYGGTSSTALTLQTEVAINPQGGGAGPAAGQPPFTHTVTSFSGYTAGADAFFEVFVWNSFYTTPQLSLAAGISNPAQPGYYGANNIFQMIPGSSISYPPITGGGNSTWVAAGDENPLYVSVVVPEPTTLALLGLGAAGMLIFRRRK